VTYRSRGGLIVAVLKLTDQPCKPPYSETANGPVHHPFVRTIAISTKSKSGPRTATKSTGCSTLAILDKARELFAEAAKRRPRIRLTTRQRTRVLDRWPKQ
jgi:hypothetical protein